MKTAKMVVLPLEELAKRGASVPSKRSSAHDVHHTAQEEPSAPVTLREATSSPSFKGGPPSSDPWMKEEPTTDRITERSIAIPAPLAPRVRATLTVLTGLNAGEVFSLDA